MGCLIVQNLEALNSKELKKISEMLTKDYDFSGELDYYFFLNKKSDKLFIINKDFAKIDTSRMRINSLGLYFGQIYDGSIRLSIEGSQLVGPFSDKNILEISPEKMRLWLKGQDIAHPGDSYGFLIIKCGQDYIGCAKHKNGFLLNHVPKERRINSID